MNEERNEGHNEAPSQELRDELSSAIEANDAVAVEKLLLAETRLANADLRKVEDRNVFSNGHPLYRASERNFEKLVELLLKFGSDADAPGPDPDDRPVHGMPLHFAAAEHQNYRLAHVLLDHGATPNSYPNCDKATIERMFYHARDASMSDFAVRRAFAPFLPDQAELESQTFGEVVGTDAAEAVKLYARMVDLGAQTPLVVLVREAFHDLAMEIVDHSHSKDGTPHDHPNSTVRNNIAGAARWYGYPALVKRLMKHSSYRYSYDDAISTIGVAIASHNRDGSYAEYREIILLQLEAIKSHGDLEKAQQDAEFKPHFHLATDFTWHENYGYRAAIAEPECYVDLAELFVSWGIEDIEHRDPQTDHSPLSAAVKRGHHPGIATYIRWLLERGADLRKSAPSSVNPIAIAKEKSLEEIHELLTSYDA